MFVQEVKGVVERVGHLRRSSSTRLASAKEIEILEKNGNVISETCEIFIHSDSYTADWLTKFKANVFLNTNILAFSQGKVSLGSKFQQGTPDFDSGIYNCTLSNVVIDGPVFAKDCSLVHSCYIAPNCALIGNGIITGCASAIYGFGSEVILCEETGTRSILSSPDLTLESVVSHLSSNEKRKNFNSSIKNDESQILRSLVCDGNKDGIFLGSIFGRNSVILNNSKIQSVFLKGDSIVTACSQITHSVIQSGCSISSSSVMHSIVNAAVCVENFAQVEHSILLDFSKISVHAKVLHSLIGSYSGVESGECISSLIGPFVGFHHQALCIATYWPQGRGNIGYGANVGSNHSGKAPDCELVCGEGIFFGLATVIKFPSNFSRAVYSLIASGVTCLAQKLEFPFSLINSPSSIPPPAANPNVAVGGLNEIFPGWVLSDNMFTLLRNEEKFKKRQNTNTSRIVYEHQVFRQETMELVLDARNRLRNVSPGPKGTLYTESDIPGLGKNFLTEPARLRAIDTYSFILRWYALRGLYRRAVEVGIDCVGEDSKKFGSEFSFCMKILRLEGMNLNQPKSLLEEFSKLDFLISSNCVASKTKDDVRGAKIIGPSYSEFHPPASQHPVCVNAKKNSAQVDQSVAKIVAKL